MTETAKAVIDRLQGEAGYATGGEVDKLVYSGLDVHTMLNEIEQAIDTDENKVEKLQERCDRYEKALKEISSSREYFSSGEISKFLPTEDAKIAIDALAALGGDDE